MSIPKIPFPAPTLPQQDVNGFMLAAGRGDEAAVAGFLTRYVVDAEGSGGYTALMSAAENGHRNIVEMLLQKGADIHKRDKSGLTVLMHAARGGDIEIVELLLRSGAVFDVKSDGGYTAQMHAQSNKHSEVAAYLEHWPEIKKRLFLADTDFHHGLDHVVPRPRPFKLPSVRAKP